MTTRDSGGICRIVNPVNGREVGTEPACRPPGGRRVKSASQICLLVLHFTVVE